jgi:hypothetical protein
MAHGGHDGRGGHAALHHLRGQVECGDVAAVPVLRETDRGSYALGMKFAARMKFASQMKFALRVKFASRIIWWKWTIETFCG